MVAWGGGDAINNVIKYLGPGIQLVSFDPKTSISMIGPEAFQSPEAAAEVAELAASDVTVFNQDACLASRFIFVEGERAGIDGFSASADSPPPPADIKDEVEMLQLMAGAQVWGRPRPGTSWGGAHDTMFPLQRFVHWMSDEDAISEAMF